MLRLDYLALHYEMLVKDYPVEIPCQLKVKWIRLLKKQPILIILVPCIMAGLLICDKLLIFVLLFFLLYMKTNFYRFKSLFDYY